jgi:hypothetical protein
MCGRCVGGVIFLEAGGTHEWRDEAGSVQGSGGCGWRRSCCISGHGLFTLRQGYCYFPPNPGPFRTFPLTFPWHFSVSLWKPQWIRRKALCKFLTLA